MNNAIEIAIRLPPLMPIATISGMKIASVKHQPDEQVDGERDQPLAIIGKLDGDRNAFRGHDLAPLACACPREIPRCARGPSVIALPP